MKERTQRKLIRSKIEAGASPQQVYDELHGPGNAADEQLADLVRYVPTPARRIEYRTGQWVLMGLLCLAIGWKLSVVVAALGGKELASAVYHSAFGIGYAVALVAVAKYWRKAYVFAGMLAFFEIMRVHDQPPGMDGVSLLVTLFFCVLAVLGLYLQRKLTPDYIKLKEQYRNNEGQARLRELVRFGD